MLTKHCNEIADRAGWKTWANAQQSSKRMFEAQGFKAIHEFNIDMTELGVPESEGLHWVFMRDPQAVYLRQ